MINGSALAATNLQAGAESSYVGLATATTLSTTEMSTDLTLTADITGRSVVWRSGALNGIGRTILSYNGTTKTMTFEAVGSAASAGDQFTVV